MLSTFFVIILTILQIPIGILSNIVANYLQQLFDEHHLIGRITTKNKFYLFFIAVIVFQFPALVLTVSLSLLVDSFPQSITETAPSPNSVDYVRFEDPAGVFSFHYPNIFNGLYKRDEADLYGYEIGDRYDGTGSTIGAMFVGVINLADDSLSDDDWRIAAAKTSIIGGQEGYNFIQLGAETSEGHNFYTEWKAVPQNDSQEDEYHLLFRVEEKEGVALLASVFLKESIWADFEEEVLFSLENISWTASTARLVLESN